MKNITNLLVAEIIKTAEDQDALCRITSDGNHDIGQQTTTIEIEL